MNPTLRSPIQRHLAVIGIAAALVGCGGSDDKPAADVTEWNRLAVDLLAVDQLPPVQAHSMAIVQIAVHDALNAIEPQYSPYRYAGSAPGASPAAAVASATRTALVQLLPSAAPTIESAYASKLASLPPGSERDAGIAVGQAAAAAILSSRGGDNLDAAINKPYTPSASAPGIYQPTPPLNFVIGGGIGELAPFAITGDGSHRSSAPFATHTAAYASDYQEVKALGSAAATARTSEQTETARFWYDAAIQEWHAAARKGLADNAANEWEAARTLALVGVAMFDVTVASLETKFHFDSWRPITAIRSGDNDANDLTQGDSDWEPLCLTPPFPEHNSTHAATGAAAAGVLSRLLGDRHTFIVASKTLPGVNRSYERFSAAAAEEGISRLYCGIHFRNAIDTGLAQGDAVAAQVVNALPRAGS